MKIIIESAGKQTSISAIDEISPPQQIARVNGKNLKDAVEWMIRRVNRIADQVEERFKEMGLITEDEIEDLLAKVEEEAAAEAANGEAAS